MYTLKSIARRGVTLSAAFVLVVSSLAASAAPAFADSLNPLTKRSLSLSSSSPGWAYTDGSGNSTYAPPNSGANGKQTGNTFEFNVSSDSTSNAIKTMSFQYCTTSAGECTSPGNDTGAVGSRTDSVANQQSDLNVVAGTPYEVGDSAHVTGTFGSFVNSTSGAVTTVPSRDSAQGNYVVYYLDKTDTTAGPDGTWKQSTGWTMTATNAEDTTGAKTGKNNYIILTNSTGLGIPSDTTVKVVFFGTDGTYITNPGSGAFFVKINTYKVNSTTLTDLEPSTNANVIDGGVTVANVMNQSIQITTKVLETMEFSVGTVDPDTLDSSDGGAAGSGTQSTYEAAMGITAPTGSTPHATHGSCDTILTRMSPADTASTNVLQLGNQTAESSLATDHTYSTHSYWRLSSNSSAGATVYYSGHTLTNTEGDAIKPADNGTGNAVAPHRGTEQFGLAIAPVSDAGNVDEVGGVRQYSTDYSQEATYENGADNGKTYSVSTDNDNNGNGSFHKPRLFPLTPEANYGGGSGTVDGVSPTTTFAFNSQSDTIPAAIATESSSVVDCVTAKMRYMANIAATTPAGIYTTKVNYIAAPQY